MTAIIYATDQCEIREKTTGSTSLFEKLKKLFGSSSDTESSVASEHQRQPNSAGTPSERLRRVLQQNRDYAVFVGVPLHKPREWVVAEILAGQLLIEQNPVDLNDVKAFVVTYDSGQLIDFEAAGLSLPTGVTGLHRETVFTDSKVLCTSDLNEGRQFVRVSYAKSGTSKTHYETTLLNVSGGRLRVTKFGGYSPIRGKNESYKLNTVTGKFYSAEEFLEWYGQTSAWLEPNQSATDPNNYGSLPVLWAYYCQTEDGLTTAKRRMAANS